MDKRPKLKKIDMKFGAWNVRSLYNAGSLMTVENEISEYKSDLMGVQEVSGSELARNQQAIYIFLCKRK
jgi:hypothetical protein